MKEFELEPGEHVVREVRKHWFLFLAELLPFAILLILPFVLPHFLNLAPPLAPSVSFLNTHTALVRALVGMWLLIWWTGAWSRFTQYFLNAWILTDQRIVDIKQHGYFSREVSSVLLNRVQDVTTDVEGMLPSMLNIGDINVQSAGAVDRFHMRGIPQPEQMRDLILQHVSTKSSSDGI
jgi:hypothetical protein